MQKIAVGLINEVWAMCLEFVRGLGLGVGISFFLIVLYIYFPWRAFLRGVCGY